MQITSTRLQMPNHRPQTSNTPKQAPSDSFSFSGELSDAAQMTLLGFTPGIGAVTNFGTGVAALLDGKYLAGTAAGGGILANLAGSGTLATGLVFASPKLTTVGGGLLLASGLTAGISTLAADGWFETTGTEAAGLAAMGAVPGLGVVTNFATGVGATLNGKYVAGVLGLGGMIANLGGSATVAVGMAMGSGSAVATGAGLLLASGATAGIGAIAADA